MEQKKGEDANNYIVLVFKIEFSVNCKTERKEKEKNYSIPEMRA